MPIFLLFNHSKWTTLRLRFSLWSAATKFQTKTNPDSPTRTIFTTEEGSVILGGRYRISRGGRKTKMRFGGRGRPFFKKISLLLIRLINHPFFGCWSVLLLFLNIKTCVRLHFPAVVPFLHLFGTRLPFLPWNQVFVLLRPYSFWIYCCAFTMVGSFFSGLWYSCPLCGPRPSGCSWFCVQIPLPIHYAFRCEVL
jgi:hypothetical protein